MTYKEMITKEMRQLSKDKRVKFVGYNIAKGHQAYGTLCGCEKSCIEVPCAENLLLGICMGLSLEGYKPVAFFERSNFLLPALDAIINHLYGMPKMSGEFNFPVIIRVIIPTDKPLNCGLQHLGDYTDIIENHTDMPVVEYSKDVYRCALKCDFPACIVERKENYGKDYIA